MNYLEGNKTMTKRKVDEDKMEKVNGGFFFDQKDDALRQNVNALNQQLTEAPASKDNIINDALSQQADLIAQKNDRLTSKESLLDAKKRLGKRPIKQG